VSFEGEFFHIPPSLVTPKPLQQPHPPLLSGMRSGAGLRRTAALFDIWNPASGSVEQLSETAVTLNAMRSVDRAPIDVYQRVFPEPPFRAPGVEPNTIDSLVAAVAAARAAGFAHVIIDTAFTTEVASPQDWAEFPQRLAPVLQAAG
jgi:hypothetical protein